jgi:SAM-dependent methyltransferase
VSLDVNTKAIELARTNPLFTDSLTRPLFVEGDFETSGFRGEFDAVVFFDSLHHTLDLPRAIRGAFDALKPGGIMIASEPGVGHAQHARDCAERFDVTDRDMPPSLTSRAGRAAGFTDIRIYPQARLLGPVLYDGRMGWAGRLARLAYHTIFARRNGTIVLKKG